MDLKQAFIQIKILHASLFVGVLLLAVLSLVFHNVMDIGEGLAILPANAFYLIVIVAILLLWASGFFYKRRISQIDAVLSLDERIRLYRTAVVIRAALIEVASLLVIMGYLLSGSLTYLLIAIVPVGSFLTTFPRDEIISEAMELSYSEVQKLEE
ncbi:MAG: hypothetical protein R3222_05005 [Balneolaceae bacterium]|nr:hypothetical protein [Balneolaceae bacterium]